MEYNHSDIEKNIRSFWKENNCYQVKEDTSKPKFYVLDMFPYPSGAGLHVGHPLGYIASDIISRYKRMQGFNVMHPMGFDAFGLPAEQYALDTGQHPSVTTKQNIARYKEQLDNIGFDYDWSREINTSNPNYFKWTQWIFTLLFNSWYDRTTQQARPIQDLIQIFEKEGNIHHPAPQGNIETFTNWNAFNEIQKRNILMQYRLAYLDYAEVWWCEALNTVLANDEVVNGVSERGSFPVEKKKMRQWFLRITELADRLLDSLEHLEWSEAMKEMQRNWIGKSQGAEIDFQIHNSEEKLKVFTTRPDTIFGVDFMVIAPEHELLETLLSQQANKEVSQYITYVKSRSERERMAEKRISGVFTGFYAIHPFTKKQIPIWTSEYVLSGYGTGAIMAVPAGDERDHAFAKHFNITITNIFGQLYKGEQAISDKNIIIENSDFLSGLTVKEAQEKVLELLEKENIGKVKTNYKLRDSGFSRQRYWGEPFPVVYKKLKSENDEEISIPYLINEEEAGLDEALSTLPLELPHVEKYGPGIQGQGPLSNIPEFMYLKDIDGNELMRESDTMPGYAGSSWYFLRYMDPQNDEVFASREKLDYWNQVDIYIGGTEHAVGHLLYSRMWTKVLHDLGYLSFDEPFKKLLNQGMIQGSSRFVYRLNLNAALHIVSSIIKEFTEFEVKKLDVSESFGFDYYFPEFNLAIDVTRNNILKQRVEKFQEYDLKNNIQVAFISECEIFQYFKRGRDFLKTWLKNIIEHGKNYQSQIAKSEYYFISKSFVDEKNMENYDLIRVDVNIVDGFSLNIEKFREWREEYRNSDFILENNEYICGAEIEKMSKSKYNVVNPDDIVSQYGADTFRMYEMFLGPIELSKPWDTKGIEGVSRFIRKFWRLYMDENGLKLQDVAPKENELKSLHKTIKKIKDSTERFSFNTAVSQLMICVNELTEYKTTSSEILIPLLKVIAPYAPHISEYLWQKMGHTTSIVHESYPDYNDALTMDNTKIYPVAINGKARAEIEMPIESTQEEMMKEALKNEKIQKYLEGVEIKKVIYVKGKMLNIVIG